MHLITIAILKAALGLAAASQVAVNRGYLEQALLGAHRRKPSTTAKVVPSCLHSKNLVRGKFIQTVVVEVAHEVVDGIQALRIGA